jgi:hypothetical protein
MPPAASVNTRIIPVVSFHLDFMARLLSLQKWFQYEFDATN